jgi:hypothetical protein
LKFGSTLRPSERQLQITQLKMIFSHLHNMPACSI